MHRTGVLRAFRHRLLLRPVAKIVCRLRLTSPCNRPSRNRSPGLLAGKSASRRHARHACRRPDRWRQCSFRLGREPRTAALAAEMIAMAAMLGGRLAGGRIDGHAADRVANDRVGDGRSSFRRAATAMGVMVVVGMRQCGKTALSRTCNRGSASSDWKVKGQFRPLVPWCMPDCLTQTASMLMAAATSGLGNIVQQDHLSSAAGGDHPVSTPVESLSVRPIPSAAKTRYRRRQNGEAERHLWQESL